MRIMTRQVIVPKSISESIQILKSCAYYFPKAVFEEPAFSIHCAKRHNGGYLSLTHIAGNVSGGEDSTVILLEVHANLYFFLGVGIAFGGILGLIYCLMLHINRWIPCFGMILLGLLVGGQSLWTGAELLDSIEHKLQR
ncbi:MAG: hypothetical protein IJA75_10010 [Oscillospiraceae bacterium]|nr:hypothetical protein [Oscillospiraceae bacterium]